MLIKCILGHIYLPHTSKRKKDWQRDTLGSQFKEFEKVTFKNVWQANVLLLQIGFHHIDLYTGPYKSLFQKDRKESQHQTIVMAKALLLKQDIIFINKYNDMLTHVHD